MRRLIVTATLITLAGGALLASAQPAAATAETPAPTCTTANVLVFRGSGEKQMSTKGVYKTLHTEGYEGTPGRRALKALEAAAPGRNIDLRGVKVLDVPYEAIDVYDAAARGAAQGLAAGTLERTINPVTGAFDTVSKAYSYTLAEILRSSRDGVKQGLLAKERAVKTTPRACELPGTISIGYSQGAMANRQLIAADSPAGKSRISATLNFGDPFQMGVFGQSAQLKRGIHGSGAGGVGIFITERDRVDSVNKSADRIPYEKLGQFYGTAMQKFTLCHQYDPFCDYSTVTGLANASAHMNYVEDTEALEVGRWLADQLKPTSAVGKDNIDPEPDRYKKLFFAAPIIVVKPGGHLPLYIEGGGIGKDETVAPHYFLTYPDFDGGDPIWDRWRPTANVTEFIKPGDGGTRAYYGLHDFVQVTHYFDIPEDFRPGYYFLAIKTPYGKWATQFVVTTGGIGTPYSPQTQAEYDKWLASERQHRDDGAAPEFPYGTVVTPPAG